MNDLLRIRDGATGDIALIQRLAVDTWWTAYKPILAEEQIRYMLDQLYADGALHAQMDSGHRFLLVYGNEKPIGFASWSASTGEPGLGKLHKIYVLPEAQGKGAGRFLLDTVETSARAERCQTLELNVNRFNKARSFYEKLGFRISRSVDIPIGPYFMNDYIMRKRLSTPESEDR